MEDLKQIPRHVAIILDGNGRWAKKKGLMRIYGHRRGAFNLSKIAEYADELGIKVLSVYCFSTENWNRPEAEVNYLMALPARYYKRYKDKIVSSNIKVVSSGRKDHVDIELANLMNQIEEETKDHNGLILNICFDYGSRDEIVRGIKKLVSDLKDNKIKEEDINVDSFNNYLDTANLGDVDLLIRTSGEQRVSNFLLWQIAYAEFYFTNVAWPEFNKEELEKAIISYNSRDRRFGGLKEEQK